jgi:branched-chain amino acid transport system ATP-binding protein
MNDDEPLLDVRQVEVVYHRAATAIQGVSLHVAAKEIVTLLGPNGAGKTTTLRAISGFLDADDAEISGGEVRFAGDVVNGWSPTRLARRGLVLVPERDKIFESLTVQENRRACQRRAGSGQRPVDVERVTGYFPILSDRRRQLAGYLSGGERQMLAIASALLCQPSILLVDELSLGLAPLVTEELMRILGRLRAELGLAILLVEQNTSAALTIADRGYVIENGHIAFGGAVAELMASSDIQEFYLGRSGGRRVKSYRDVKQYRRRRRWFG